jgi:hypothetical protein
MKTNVLDHEGMELSVNGLKLEDMYKSLAYYLMDNKKDFRPDALLYSILFGVESIKSKGNDDRVGRPGEDQWDYYRQFMYNMDKIHEIIYTKKMISIDEFFLVLFTPRTLQEFVLEKGI